MKKLTAYIMNGLENNFIIIEDKEGTFAPTITQIQQIASKAGQKACDQVLILQPRFKAKAQRYVTTYNRNGTQAEVCGNGFRCVGWLLKYKLGAIQGNSFLLDTPHSRLIKGEILSAQQVRLNMGTPSFDWQGIPLERKMSTHKMAYKNGPLEQPTAVTIGNPHLVFFTPTLVDHPLAQWGPIIEKDPLFGKGINVSMVEVVTPTYLKQVVWERGAGLTRACGSGACAATAAAVSQGYCQPSVKVEQPGGILEVTWQPDRSMLLTGNVTFEKEYSLIIDQGTIVYEQAS